MKKEMSLGEKALAALKDAVARVIEEHRQSGEPLAVWRDGKAVLIPPPARATQRSAAPAFAKPASAGEARSQSSKRTAVREKPARYKPK